MSKRLKPPVEQEGFSLYISSKNDVWKIGNVFEFNFLQSKLVSSYKWLLFTESKKDTYITSSTQSYDHWVRMRMVKVRNLFLIPVILYLYFCSITAAPQCLLSNAFKIEAKQGKISWTGKMNNTMDAFGHLVDCLFVALIVLLFVAFVCFYIVIICWLPLFVYADRYWRMVVERAMNQFQ